MGHQIGCSCGAGWQGAFPADNTAGSKCCDGLFTVFVLVAHHSPIKVDVGNPALPGIGSDLYRCGLDRVFPTMAHGPRKERGFT